MGKQRWEVQSLDVWGNEKDGYDINDWFHSGWLEFDHYPSENDIFTALKAEGLIGEKVKRAWVNVDPASSSGYYEVQDNRKSKGTWMKPLYQVYQREEADESEGGGKRRHGRPSVGAGVAELRRLMRK
jgi:hypothetical protein